MDEWSKRFLKILDEALEDEATRPRGTVSLVALGIWRRTSRLYHLRDNPVVKGLFGKAIIHAGLADMPAERELRETLFGVEPGKE